MNSLAGITNLILTKLIVSHGGRKQFMFVDCFLLCDSFSIMASPEFLFELKRLRLSGHK